MNPDYTTYERLHKAIDFINSGDVFNLSFGRTDLAEGVYVNVMELETRKENSFEIHKRYIDIHCILEGEEAVEIADLSSLNITQPYNEERDIALGTAHGTRHIIRKGQYCITMPQEAHSPGLCVTNPMKIKKAVFKVAL